MNKGIKILASAVLGLAAVACSSPQKMAEQAKSKHLFPLRIRPSISILKQFSRLLR